MPRPDGTPPELWHRWECEATDLVGPPIAGYLGGFHETYVAGCWLASQLEKDGYPPTLRSAATFAEGQLASALVVAGIDVWPAAQSTLEAVRRGLVIPEPPSLALLIFDWGRSGTTSGSPFMEAFARHASGDQPLAGTPPPG